MIEAENIFVRYDDKITLNVPHFALYPSKVHVLLGANGAGKSTLMRSLLGLNKTHHGEIKLDGSNIKNYQPHKLAQKIGYLAQNVKIEWNMKVGKLIELGRLPFQYYGETTPRKDNEIIAQIVENLEISHLLNCNILEISGGELSLALLARVLVGQPEYILIDEPFNHLDLKHQGQLISAMKKFASNGGGVLAIVHDMNHALKMGDEFSFMKNGEIIANGSKLIVNEINIEEAFDVKAKILHQYGSHVII